MKHGLRLNKFIDPLIRGFLLALERLSESLPLNAILNASDVTDVL